MRDDDLELLRRIAGRDRAAFEALYHRYYRRLFGFAFKITRRPEIVEEVVHEVLFAVWQQADRFDGRSRPSTWILGIAYRKSLKALAAAGVRASVRDDEDGHESDGEPDRGPGPESLMAAREVASALGRALATLPAEQPAVVELTYFQERSYAEISELIGCPVNTVKTRMFHARRKLRRLLPGMGIAAGDLG